MSKMDNLRAMREAKYARAQERGSAQPTSATRRAPRPAVAPPPVAATPTAPAAPTDQSVAGTTDELCGHRNMGGRTCTRERGHTAKSHRYS